MPASPCHTYADQAGRAAWRALDEAETILEKILRNADDHIALIDGHGYFIGEDDRLMCGPETSDGGVDKVMAMHRLDYEGMSAEEMLDLAQKVNGWIESSSAV